MKASHMYTAFPLVYLVLFVLHRVFDAQMAKIFDSTMNHGAPMKEKYFRCTNNNDIVPRAPMPPYRHVGKQIYLDRL